LEVYILKIFLILYPALALGGQALVTGHRVPLFKSKSINSPVIQYVTKGEVIFIHDKEFGISPMTPNYDKSENGVRASRRLESDPMFIKKKKFYETLHNMAGPAYVLGKHIKLIYNDDRENHDPIYKKGKDYTDYRLKEPLRDGYPLTKEQDLRASLFVGIGNQRRNHYPYSSNMTSQKYYTRYTLNAVWLNKVNFDTFARYYYGWDFHFHNEKKLITLEDSRESIEDGGQFFFGPTLSYDGFRTETLRLSFQASFGLTWTRILVTQKSSESKDQNLYQAVSLSPKSAISFQKLKFISDIDFVAKAEVQYELSHTLRPSSQNGDQTFWQQDDEDSINVPSGARVTLYVGIQSSF